MSKYEIACGNSKKTRYFHKVAVFTLAKVSVLTPAIMAATATLIVLALATLDDATQIGSFLLAKVSKSVLLLLALLWALSRLTSAM